MTGSKVKNGSLSAADIGGPVDSATSATHADRASDSDLLDGIDSSAFQRLPKVRIENIDAIKGDLTDFTPDVAGLSTLVLNFTVPTVMDPNPSEPSFTGGVEGQRLTIVSGKEVAIMTSQADRMLSGGAWGGEKGDTLSLVLAGGIWYETGRSKNH